MKIGFSTICCPSWDLRTIFERAVGLGFDGLEIRGLQGELHLPNHPELAQSGDVVVDVCEKAGVEMVCLGTSSSFGSKKRQDVGDEKARVREHIELARKLRCPFVRVFTGDIADGSNRGATLDRIAEALTELVAFAGRQKITILIENSGDLAGSGDLWFLLDAVSHPALQACWNPINGLSLGEPLSIAVPRLGRRLGMVHLADASFQDSAMQGYRALGQGTVNIPRVIELLTGITFQGYLMLDWPKLWDDSLTDAESYLPASIEYLRDLLNVERKPLSAYKGDKNPVKFVDRPPSLAARS